MQNVPTVLASVGAMIAFHSSFVPIAAHSVAISFLIWQTEGRQTAMAEDCRVRRLTGWLDGWLLIVRQRSIWCNDRWWRRLVVFGDFVMVARRRLSILGLWVYPPRLWLIEYGVAVFALYFPAVYISCRRTHAPTHACMSRVCVRATVAKNSKLQSCKLIVLGRWSFGPLMVERASKCGKGNSAV